MNQNVSVDIDLPPDEYNGLIYVIDGNDGKSGTPVLKAIDPVNWTEKVSATLPKDYDAHSVVSLLPDSHNFLYVWSNKRTNAQTPTCPYTAVSSDVSIYDRNTLAYLTTIPNVRTGFDSTLQSADDEPQSYNMGRGLVVIVSDQTNIESSRSAHIIRIDESVTPPTWETIVESTDIGGYNIDIESPMPDYDGGLYFECYSGDANATTDTTKRESRIIHWKKDGTIASTHRQMTGLHSNGELVISSGTLKGQIVVFMTVAAENTASDNTIHVYLWDGEAENGYTEIGGLEEIGVEIEKPFSDGKNGLYFMTERKSGTDEADALCRWDGPSLQNFKLIWSSDCEMEVEGEAVPKDGKNGFYFVNVSTDLTDKSKEGKVNISLLHCQESEASIVCDLGTFDIPASRFNAKDETGTVLTPQEALENEYGFLEDEEHDVLFVGGGPLGGKYKLTVLKWTSETRENLDSSHILTTFSDEELGGSANIAGAVAFDDTVNGTNSSSSSGCNVGLKAVFALLCLVIFVAKKKFERYIWAYTGH